MEFQEIQGGGGGGGGYFPFWWGELPELLFTLNDHNFTTLSRVRPAVFKLNCALIIVVVNSL